MSAARKHNRKKKDQRRLYIFLALVLIVTSLAVMRPLIGGGFINHDDNEYVLGNQAVRQLSISKIFTELSLGNYQPLTTLTYAVDHFFWGFDPAGVQPRIDIWHGDADVNVPVHAATYLHDKLPQSQLTTLPGAGHFLILDHWQEVLATLVA